MKVLLVCAAGMSTSILMKKLEKYAATQNIDFQIEAVGLNAYKDVCSKYDCILMGPQVGYRKDEVVKGSGKPVDVIKPQDYGIGNCANIFSQIDALIAS
jgi:PTS system cellobiose-specific IIB component